MGIPAMDLYCLPCAGASAGAMYLRWQRLLPAWINVAPLELPGRGRRLDEPLVEDFQTLVEQLCDEIAQGKQGKSQRWAIFGHSMGALLAYGITARLQTLRASTPVLSRPEFSMPERLFASASPAPSRRDPDELPDTNDDAALIADLRKQGGTPQEVFDSPELLHLTLTTLRADYRVCESFDYDGSPPLAMPVQVFAGRQDDIEAHRIEAWRDEAGGSFDLHWFDGGHFFIRAHERQVLRLLERSLGTAMGAVIEEGGDVRTASG